MATATTHKPRVDDRDWTKLTFGEQVRMLEVEGYLVLPNVLTEEQLEVLRAEAGRGSTPREPTTRRGSAPPARSPSGAAR